MVITGIALVTVNDATELVAAPRSLVTIRKKPLPDAAIGTRFVLTLAVEETKFVTPVWTEYQKKSKGAVPATADHSALLSQMRDLLAQKIAAGANPATAQEVAVCPLCGCPLTVTAQSSF